MIVAEREFDLERNGEPFQGIVQIHAPVLNDENGTSSWRCAYRVSWPGFEHQHAMFGVDSYQALTLTLQIIPVIIETSDDLRSGRAVWKRHTFDFNGRPFTSPSLEESFGLKPLSSGPIQ